jgi:hypothetical protein
MVKHHIFGVERDNNIPADFFPTEEEEQEMEDFFSDVETGVFPTEKELQEMDDFFSDVETGLGMAGVTDKVQTETMPGFELPHCIVHGTEDNAILIKGSEHMWDKAAIFSKDRVFQRQEGVNDDPTAEASTHVSINITKKRITNNKKK